MTGGRLTFKRRTVTRITIERVYDAPAASDGVRIPVERLRLRGIAKERAALDAAPESPDA